MKSNWFHLKDASVQLRQKGQSIREIEKKLGIPRSTLSGWFSRIPLSVKQKQRLQLKWQKALVKARQRAAKWHQAQKLIRKEKARTEAGEVCERLSANNGDLVELAMAMLYLGEGFKKSIGMGLGNSDPNILKFFISGLKQVYSFPVEKIKCELHLRHDQDPVKMKKYWSKQLGIPVSNFITVSVDHRTKKSPTYPNYHGVCVLRCGAVAIQRKLMYLSEQFCQSVISLRA